MSAMQAIVDTASMQAVAPIKEQQRRAVDEVGAPGASAAQGATEAASVQSALMGEQGEDLAPPALALPEVATPTIPSIEVWSLLMRDVPPFSMHSRSPDRSFC